METGKLIRKYARSRSQYFALFFLASLFGGVGAFLLFVIPQIGKNIKFDGDVSILYSVGYGGIGVALLIILMTIISMKGQPVFYIYENAIRSVGKKGDRLDYFAEIEDIFIYYYGGFGYRTSPNSPWVFAGARNSKLGQLTQNLIEQQVKHRGEKLFQELLDGKTVKFRYISNENALSKSLWSTRNLDFPTFEIELTRHQLKMDNRSIPVMKIADITTNLWVEKAKIIDVDGNVFCNVHTSAIMSFNLLYELLAWLQQYEMNGANQVVAEESIR